MIELSDLKLHVRVDSDDEDGLLQRYLDAAKASALDYLDLDKLPEGPAIDAAILLGAADLYTNRESQSDTKLEGNATYEALLRPYRRFA